MFIIEVYSSETHRWYLWLDAVKPANVEAEKARASKLYDIVRAIRSA